MSDSPASRVEILPYGPRTREEAIAIVKERRRKIGSKLHRIINHRPQQVNGLSFWVGYAAVISQWVRESQFHGFFESEGGENENAIQDLEGVLYGEQTAESGDESNNHFRRKTESREMLQLKWKWLARECMDLARAFLPAFVNTHHPTLSFSVQNKPPNPPSETDVQHMLEVMQTKNILFMAEQARHGDLSARKELVRLLIMDGDCQPRGSFTSCTTKFTAEITAKYSLISERMHRRRRDHYDGRYFSRVNYWYPIVQQYGYMEHTSYGPGSIHIVPKQLNMRGWVLAFAEPGNRLWWPSNGLFMDNGAGYWIQALDSVIVPSGGPDSGELEIHVLDKRKVAHYEYIDEGAEPGSPKIPIQGRKLVFNNRERPDTKALYFHWLLAVLKWMLDPDKERLDPELAKEELSRHDEIWGTDREYVRQELLEALAKKSGIDIPIANAIPDGRVSDVDIAEILVEEIYHDERHLYREHPEHGGWLFFPRGTAHPSSEFYARRIREAIECLDEETSNLADTICQADVFDFDGYDSYWENNPRGYRRVFTEIYEEEYDEEMDDFFQSFW